MSDPIVPDQKEVRTAVVVPPRSWQVLTWLLALIAAGTSLTGLLADWPYANETSDWRLQARAQDIGNLVSVVALLAGFRAARRGRAAGWQVWLGSLICLAYAFAVYAFTVHFGSLFLGYVAALGLAVYALLFASVSGSFPAVAAVRSREVAGAWLVGGLAVLFGLRWLTSIISAQVSGKAPAELALDGLITNPVHVLDLGLLLPGMLLSALAVRRHGRTAGFWLGACLVFAALMSVGMTAARVFTEASVTAVVMLATMTGASAVMAVALLRAQAATDR